MIEREERAGRSAAAATIRAHGGTGFEVVRSGKAWIVAEPAPGGLRVARGTAVRWFLKRVPGSGSAGFVLSESAREDAREVARSSRIPAEGNGLSGTMLVLSDGRAFVVRDEIGRDGYVVMSWEGFGPYATLVRARKGWRLDVTLAGRSLAEDAQMVTLLAAELTAGGDEFEGEHEDETRCKTRVTASRRGGATGEDAAAARAGKAAPERRSRTGAGRTRR